MLVFASLKSLIPKVNGTVTDNWVFRLHCRVTLIFLIASTILATSREYIGDPIECASDTDKPPTNVINQYCWVESTFSFPGAIHDLDKADENDAYPGVRPRRRGDSIVYHKYYQWVVFMLCLQTILFYIPRYLWKIWEGGKVRMLLQELNHPIIEDEAKIKQMGLLTDYFVNNLQVHNSYAYRYAFCEILNLVNVIGQIFMIDKFLGGEFLKYGLEVFSFVNQDQSQRMDPMIKIFPRLTKCSFRYYGMSGDMQNKEVVCVLPLNVINEKIYVFMWLWFCILTSLTCVAVLYRFLVMLIPYLRVMVIHSRSGIVPVKKIEIIVSKLTVGDWFVLYQLSKNMDPTKFNEFMQLLNGKLECHGSEYDNANNAYSDKGKFTDLHSK